MEEHRTARIADRRSEYQQRQMHMILTPERHDPFAGLSLIIALIPYKIIFKMCSLNFTVILIFIIMICLFIICYFIYFIFSYIYL